MFHRPLRPGGVGELQRAALAPLAERVGVDLDRSLFQPPVSAEAIGVEALRCCSGLLVAFAYADAWPAHDRSDRRRAKRAAALVQDAFHDDRARDAISWAAQRYGRVMAEMQRQTERQPPQPAAAVAEADEWLARVVAELWPVSNRAPIAFGQKSAQPVRAISPAAPIEIWSAAARREATIEMLSIATWPEVDAVSGAFWSWTNGADNEFDAGVLSDWLHVSHFWMNLIDPGRRRSHDEVISSSGE